MERNDQYYNKLFDGWLHHRLNAAQERELLQWIYQLPDGGRWEKLLAAAWNHKEANATLTEDEITLIVQQAMGSDEKENATGIIRTLSSGTRRSYWWIAAAVIFLFAMAGYLWLGEKEPAPAVAVKSTDIQPGQAGAVLILNDGSQVSLDTVRNAMIALQGDVRARMVNGVLQYEGTGTEAYYNTIATPNGRQFHVILPDGTRVWLNAASSIRYPTVFTTGERRVQVTGEVYFEVAKNKKMPFHVSVNNKAQVEVLGTKFNINAYENESHIATTLLEGAVSVSSANKNAVVLKPGQQARIQEVINVVNNTDVDKVMAWKNGLFDFEGLTFTEVMNQLERWYDIEVEYEKGVPQIEFGGKMTKNILLSDLLVILERSGVHFRMEGRRLIVLP